MKKKSASLLAAVGLTVGLLGAAVPTAAVAGNASYCGGAWVCVYKNSNFGIGMGWRTAGFGLQNISAVNNNEASSWENRTGTAARWYADGGGTGACHTMARFSELSYMSPFGQNDNMSSWAGNGAC